MGTARKTLGGAGAATVAMLVLACSHDTNPPPQQPRQPVTTTSASLSEGTGTPRLEDLSDPASRHAMADSPAGVNPLDAPSPTGPVSAVNDEPRTTPATDPGPSTTTPDVLTRAEPRLSDDQVIAVVIGANEGEVKMADFAIRNATAPDVKQFAVMMKTHHTSGLQKARSTQSKAKLASSPSDVSIYLDNEVTTALKAMHDKSGASFDRAYMDSQVQAHKDVLAAIDHRLSPSATNGELRSLLTETRQVVASHLTKAQELTGRMSPATSTATPAPSRQTSGSSLSQSAH